MIDRQTYLVARREFIENARTKTFWIGIISLPVIIAVAIGISILLKSAKGEKTFVVLDRTDGTWVSTAVQETSMRGSVQRMAELADSDDAAAQTERAEIAEKIRTRIESLPPDHPWKDLQRRVTEAGGGDAMTALRAMTTGGGPGSETVDPETQEAVQAAFSAWTAELTQSPEKQAQVESFVRDFLSLNDDKFVQKELADLELDPEAEDLEEQLDKAVGRGDLFAYFVIPDNALESPDGARYVSENVTDDDLRKWYSDQVTETIRDRRIKDFDLTQAQAAALRENFRFDQISVDESGAQKEVSSNEKAAGYAPLVFVYLLWIAVFTAANMLLTNTVEEKSNRLIEVLLSSVSPIQLMTGKILGIGATGLTIVVTWVITSLIGVQFAGDALGGLDLTSILANPLYLASFILYFLAGYLMFGAILVAMGSVCNSLKESQNLMQPVMILLMVPLIAMVFVVQEPNGTVARILTYIPIYTPFLMMNRAGGPPPTWEYIASTALILFSLWFFFRAAAKVFRVGILMTGKPPKLKEVWHWLRAPVGTVAARPVAED